MQCYSNARVMQAEPSLFFSNIVNQQLSLRQDDGQTFMTKISAKVIDNDFLTTQR